MISFQLNGRFDSIKMPIFEQIKIENNSNFVFIMKFHLVCYRFVNFLCTSSLWKRWNQWKEIWFHNHLGQTIRSIKKKNSCEQLNNAIIEKFDFQTRIIRKYTLRFLDKGIVFLEATPNICFIFCVHKNFQWNILHTLKFIIWCYRAWS